MPDQASIEELTFIRCIHLNTEGCPLKKNPALILSILKDPPNFTLDDPKVKELNGLCGGCQRFKEK